MQGAAGLTQGKKGTGGNTRQIGVRVPLDLYGWIEDGRGPRETDTDRVLMAVELARDVEERAGQRMAELRAHALLEHGALGSVIADLALEALDARRKGRR